MYVFNATLLMSKEQTEMQREIDCQVDGWRGLVGEVQSRHGVTTSSTTKDNTQQRKASLAVAHQLCQTSGTKRYERSKRLFDIHLALMALVLFSPLLLLVAFVVLLDVGRPLIFWQERPGRGGKPFRLYKMRTMRPPLSPQGERRSDDKRLSNIGKLLRRTRLDELPQLINILTGEMSFVGPRPLLSSEQPKEYQLRLLVRPGLTGWAQIQSLRSTAVADKAVLDIWYIRHASFALDLWIICRTVPFLIYGEHHNQQEIERSWRHLQDIQDQ